jgi:hypothetical protein
MGPGSRGVIVGGVMIAGRRTAAWPRAVARNVVPTPTGPMITALWPPSTKRSEHSSFQVAWS